MVFTGFLLVTTLSVSAGRPAELSPSTDGARALEVQGRARLHPGAEVDPGLLLLVSGRTGAGLLRTWPPADLASGSEIPPGLSPDSTHGRSHAPGSKSPDRSGPLHPEGRVASLWRWKEVACRSGKAPSTGRRWTSKSPQTPERCCWRRSLGRGAPAGPRPGSCASGDARSPLTPVPGVRKNQGGG